MLLYLETKLLVLFEGGTAEALGADAFNAFPVETKLCSRALGFED